MHASMVQIGIGSAAGFDCRFRHCHAANRVAYSCVVFGLFMLLVVLLAFVRISGNKVVRLHAFKGLIPERIGNKSQSALVHDDCHHDFWCSGKEQILAIGTCSRRVLSQFLLQ